MGRLREARDVLEQVDALAARTNSVPSVQGYGAVVMGCAPAPSTPALPAPACA